MAMAATPSRPGDHETEFTRPGVSEDEIEEIRKVFTMMDTQNGKRPARGQLDPNQLMEAMNALGIVWKKSDVYQTLAEVDHDNSGTVGLEEFINLTTALVTLFAKFDHGGDGYVDLAKLRFVCRELGEQLGSGSEQADDQLREMLKHASKDGSGERVTKDELYDCLAKTRLM
jgi:centrin-1